MFGEEKIEVFENHNSLEITLNWFSAKAYFLLLFCFAWIGFLFFWYTTAVGEGAPLIFKLFPLIHVAVGVGMSYYTACLFFNKTFIDISDDYLTITHKPIPWWRGNTEVPIKEIKQIYVKESISRSKNGSQHSYALRVKKQDDSDHPLMSVSGISSQSLLQVETYLEKHIGIEDQAVKGEFSSPQRPGKVVEARRQRRDFSSSELVSVYHFNKGEFMNLNHEYLEIVSVTQYDWNDGNSDKLFQMVDSDKVEKLLYIEQNKALLSAWEETALSIIVAGAVSFKKEDPPPRLNIEDEDYFLSSYKTGHGFVTGLSRSLEIEEWIYKSKDEKSYIRITNNKNLITYHKGEQLFNSDFKNTLDLNNPPEREIEYRKPKYDDEDLV